MKPHPLNTLAVWLPMNTDGLSVKAFNEGYPYIQNGVVMRSSPTRPITRYAKNYTKSKKKFSLCLISDEQDTKLVEAWMNEQAKELKAKDIELKFKMLDNRYER